MTSQTGADKPLAFENRCYSTQQFTCRIGLDRVAAGTRTEGRFHYVNGAVIAHEQNFGS